MTHVTNAEQFARRTWRRLNAGASLLLISLFASTVLATLAAYDHWLTTGVICYRRTLLAIVLGIGTGGSLTMLVVAWRRFTRQSRFTAATARLAAVPLPAALCSHANALGLNGRVTAFASPVPAAFVAGLRRPHIYVSTALVAALDEDELPTVLRHEARHLVRRDPWRQALAQAFQAAWPGLPGIARLSHEFRLAMELEADAAAIADPTDRWHLASALLKVLKANDAVAAGAVVAGTGAGAGAVASLDGLAAVRLARLTGRPLAAAAPSVSARRAQAAAIAGLVAIAVLWWCPAVMGSLL